MSAILALFTGIFDQTRDLHYENVAMDSLSRLDGQEGFRLGYGTRKTGFTPGHEIRSYVEKIKQPAALSRCHSRFPRLVPV